MALTGDFGKLHKLAASIAALGKANGAAQRDTTWEVVKKVRVVLREQFETGSGPYGFWDRTKRGQAALVSNQLDRDFRGQPVPGGAYFFSRLPWLRTHHEGHTFPSRSVGDRQQVLRFDKKGRLRSKKSFGRLRRGHSTFARGHSIGQRVLPRREIYPDRGMPDKWAAAINAGAAIGISRWYAGTVR
jgi:hypothetical protein